MKQLLITAGGTAEKIDQVRSITNHSTGQLGSLIAEAFLAHGYQVDYLTTPTALRPVNQDGLALHFMQDTKELDETLMKDFPGLYMGFTHFHHSTDAWAKRLKDFLTKI